MERIPNSEQQKVIHDLTNNIILFASAGTGKTFTVANRVANILASGKATANEILCLTFTIKASKEMSEDIFGYAGKAAQNIFINTIHGFCYRILLEEDRRVRNQYSTLTVCDEVDEEEILRSILSSRYPYWQLEEDLKEHGIAMPDLEKCDICKIKDRKELFFKVEDKLVDLSGKIHDIPDDAQYIEVDAYCPICKEIQPLDGRQCAKCGNAHDFRLNSCNFDVFKKKSTLRELVSELKHYRESAQLYTNNEEEDFRQAFEDIKKYKENFYTTVVSHYAAYIGPTIDEAFEYAIQRFVNKLLVEYNAYMQASDLVDFDDLILKANTYLKNEEVLSRWRTRFKYIIVDEMQDTSVLEYQVLKKIFANNNVMLCGDFFQTIYEWRGSCPEKVLDDYINDFSAKIYMFAENYRSTKTLAYASFGYLKNAYPQLIGKYCPSDLKIHSKADGEQITCHAFSNREEEAWKIYKYLQATKDAPSKNCIIARTNNYIAELYNYFENFNNEETEENKLRFFTVEKNFNFFKKPVVKDILAALRLLVNRLDRLSLERLTQKYVSKVGVKTIEALRGYNEIGVSILSFIDPQTHLYGDCYHHLIEGYEAENIVIYDTETTGLDLAKDQIVQISAIKLGRNGKIIDTLDLLVEPTIEITQAAYETHGFSLEYIRQHNGISPVEALQKFADFTNGSVLVGHNNLAYDKPLVCRQLEENSLPPLNLIADYDTLVIAKQFYAFLPDFKLATLCQRFNVVNECAHNALGDITATGQCLIAMLEEKIIPTTVERVTLIKKHREKFEKLYAFIEEMRALLQNNQPLVSYIIERLKLKSHYTRSSDYEAMRDMIDALQPINTNMQSYLKDFLKDAALSGSQMDVLIKKLNRIPIITVHQSKGCEFDTVILAGADDSNFPCIAAKGTNSEEEEKKVFYVAITRAKQKLVLTRATKHYKHTIRETPYFWLIPGDYIQTNHAWRTGE